MIYKTNSGFRKRVNTAKKMIIAYAEQAERPFCRKFDNCFEMYDGSAVVYKIMEECLKNRKLTDPKYPQQQALILGVKLLGDSIYSDWAKVYKDGKEPTLDLFSNLGVAC